MSPHRPPSRAALVGGLCVVALAAVVAALAYDPVPLNEDLARHFLIAQDCRVFSECGIGAPSSWLLWEGGLWIRILAGLTAVGGGIEGLRLLVIGAHALAAVLVYVALRRVVPPIESACATAIVVGLNLLVAGEPVIWNVSLAPVAAAGFFWLLIRLAESGRSGFAFAAGLTAAVCAEFHLAGLLLLPAALLLAAAFATRPAHGLVACLLGFGVVLLLVSAEATARNLQRLPAELLAIALVAGGVTVAIGCAIRPVIRNRPFAVHAYVMLVVVVLATLAPPGLARLLEHPVAWRYVPLLPVAAGLFAACSFTWFGTHRLLRAVAVVAVSGGAIVTIRGWLAEQEPRLVARPETSFTYAEASRLGEAFRREQAEFAGLATALHGERPRELLMAIAAQFPLAAPDASEATATLLFRRDASLPPLSGTRAIELGTGRVAVLASFPPYVRREQASVCSSPRGTEVCIAARRWSAMLSSARYHDRWDVVDRRLCQGEPGPQRRARFEIRIDVDGPHLVWSPEGAIVAITGVSYRGELPASGVWLLPDGGQQGAIEIAMSPQSCFLPEIVEVPDGPVAHAFMESIGR